MALALNSRRPAVLQNTSVGIDTVETFRHPVNIRVNHDDSLEMVFYAASQAPEYMEIAPDEPVHEIWITLAALAEGNSQLEAAITGLTGHGNGVVHF